MKLRDNIEDNKSLKYNVPPSPPPYPPIIRLPSIRSSLRNTQNSNTEESDDNSSKEYKFIDSLSKSEYEFVNNKINLLNIKQTKSEYTPDYEHEDVEEGTPINCATQ